ncbi:hypothetical protein BDF22DRAFT_687416 [Syncephalis plumigaleata]|nr:hypothetical protein BDF22DRAFT_687416 [Syncephalis plumigaleata]
MLFGTKSVFVTCATALMLVSTTLVAVDAKPQPLNEGGVPGLKIDPNNPYFGTLETLPVQAVASMLPDKPIPELEQSLIIHRIHTSYSTK